MSALSHPLVIAADRFAAGIHASSGRMRQYTDASFINHSRAVAHLMSRFTRDPELVGAAVLHATCDGPGETLDMIQREFGDRVAHLVQEAASEGTALSGASEGAKSIRLAAMLGDVDGFIAHEPRAARKYLEGKSALLPHLVGGNATLHSVARKVVLGAIGRVSETHAKAAQAPPARPFGGRA